MPSSSSEKPPAEMVPYKVHWFRSTIFQVIVVGGVFFCAPGMYVALNALGAGGLASPWYVNAATAAGYVTMAVLSITGGIIVNNIGVRRALFISSTGDLIYAGGLYLNSKNGTQWFLLFGSIVSGMTAGLMYSVEGPIITSYPEPNRRGRMLSLWVFMRSAAPVIGGAIIFALNSKLDSSGSVSLHTYLVIIGIMCAGPFISLLISNPDKVQRRDGIKVTFRKKGWVQTMRQFFRVISSKNILLLCPFFFTSWFYSSYIVTLRVRFFNVRTRGLCALVLPWADIAGGFATGYFLDQSKLSVKRRARLSWIFLMALNLGLWVWSGVLTKLLEGHGPGIDWTSGSIFNEIFALAIMFEFAALSTQTLIYWLISHMSDDFITLSYITGGFRGIECVGQAVAYGIKSHNTTDWLSIGLNIGFLVLSLPFAWPVIRKIGVDRFEEFNINADNVDEKSGDVEVKVKDPEDDSITTT